MTVPVRTNADVGRVLATLATMLELDGANSFRVRAYREAARVVDAHPEPLAKLVDEAGGLEELPGIGKDLAQKIRDVLATGSTALYDEMLEKYPLELVRLTELQGLGAKRVRALYDALGIRDRAGLEAAAKAGKLRDLPGFGEKTEQNVLRALEVAGQSSGRMLLAQAWAVAHELAESLRAVPGVKRVELAGSFRRRRDTVGDLDLLATGGEPERVMAAFAGHERVAEVLARGETKSSVRLTDGLQVDLRLVPADSFGAALLYFTGSKAHNIELRRVANDQGLTLNEYGLAREGAHARPGEGEVVAGAHRGGDLPGARPRLDPARAARGAGRDRAGAHGTAAEADRGGRPARRPAHAHLAQRRAPLADRDGAGGARARLRLRRHHRALAGAGHGRRLRRGAGASARWPRSPPSGARCRASRCCTASRWTSSATARSTSTTQALDRLDWVVASLHSRLAQPAAEATARVLRALEHPAVCALGHPTGRMIGTRPASPFDMEKVIERAAALGVALEINSQPDRLDLSDAHARLAKDKGATMVIDSDAHSIATLDLVRYGVFVARRAGLEKDDVLNTLPYARLRKALRKGGAGSTRRRKPTGDPT